MPFHFPQRIKNLSECEFDERDRIVMRCAFDSQNALGRLCDERVYENDLARRLRAEGFRDVFTQMQVTVVHKRFQKVYRVDLLADSALYELKTVNELIGEHDAQILNYGMMLNVNHCKLLNFRNERVEGRLRYNAVTSDTRRDGLSFDETDWQPLNTGCLELMRYTRALLNDLGAFLDFRLYEEAIVHYFGGEEHAVMRHPLTIGGADLGTHRFASHAADTSFMVTGFSNSDSQASHVRRLLGLSSFKAMQWINFHHNEIKFSTIKK